MGIKQLCSLLIIHEFPNLSSNSLSLAANSSVFAQVLLKMPSYFIPLKWHFKGTLDKLVCSSI